MEITHPYNAANTKSIHPKTLCANDATTIMKIVNAYYSNALQSPNKDTQTSLHCMTYVDVAEFPSAVGAPVRQKGLVGHVKVVYVCLCEGIRCGLVKSGEESIV